MSGYHFDADKKAILPIYTNKSTVDLPYFEHVPDLFWYLAYSTHQASCQTNQKLLKNI